MSNNKLLSYKELAKRYYIDLTEWCKSQQESDLYINSGKVDTLSLKANLTPSLNDVVYGLREDGHTDKAENLKSAIADTKKAVEDYDFDNENSNISETQLRRKAQWLMEKVVSLFDELKALFRPTASQKPAEKRQDITPAEEQEEKAKEITSINIQNFKGILGDVQQAENIQIGDNATIHNKSKKEKKNIETRSFQRILWLLKKIPNWIYVLVIFLAALFTIFHYLGWLEPIKGFIAEILVGT